MLSSCKIKASFKPSDRERSRSYLNKVGRPLSVHVNNCLKATSTRLKLDYYIFEQNARHHSNTSRVFKYASTSPCTVYNTSDLFMIQFVSNKVFLCQAWTRLRSATDDAGVKYIYNKYTGCLGLVSTKGYDTVQFQVFISIEEGVTGQNNLGFKFFFFKKALCSIFYISAKL